MSRYAEALARLAALGRMGIHPGLDELRAALARLGSPERQFPSLHVAGTNGKGSTSAIAESILRASGLRTGLYTSPHLSRFTERVRVNGKEVDNDTIAALAEEVFALGERLSFFEAATAIAFLAFARAQIDVAIVEVGLGGRLDATNVCAPFATVITSIGLDHTELLGDTLAAIAFEKAGIIKRGVPLITGELPAEAERAIALVAEERGAPCFALGRELSARIENDKLVYEGPGGAIAGARLGLAGPHQTSNAALALAATSFAAPPPDEAARRAGLSSVSWPGRLERIGDVWLDGAHNEEGARTLTAALPSLDVKEPVILLGVLADKDARALLTPLVAVASRLVCTTPPSPRALAASDLARIAQELVPRLPVAVAHDPADALVLARSLSAGAPLVACGSLYLIGALRRALTGEPADPLAVSDPAARASL